MAFERKVIGLLQVFSMTVDVDTDDYIGDVADCTMNVEVETEEGKGVGDRYAYPIPVGKKWNIEATVFSNSTVGIHLIDRAIAGGEIGFVFSAGTGIARYAGTAHVKTTGKKIAAGSIIQYSLSIEGKGAVTRTVP